LTPTPDAPKDRFKEIKISWREEGDDKLSTAWLKVLKNGTLLARLPNYGPYHLHFGLTHPTENTSYLFIQFSDDREPQGTPDRRISLLRIGPVSNDDFRRLRDWLTGNAEVLGTRAVRLFLDSFSWKSFSYLQEHGWKNLPTVEELLESDKAHKGKIKMGESDVKQLLNGPLERASRMLALPGDLETDDLKGVALRSGMKKEDLPKAKAESAGIGSDEKTPPWLKALTPELRQWIDENSNCTGEGPIYLVGDAVKMKTHFRGLAEIILDGAISSFQDVVAREWLMKLKSEALSALRGEKEFDLQGLLGFDLRRILADPEKAKEILPPEPLGGQAQLS
jgi:hypothetical protein